MKQPIIMVMYTCGQRASRGLATIERGTEWTRSYHLSEYSSTRLANLICQGIMEGSWRMHPHAMGWTAYPIERILKK